MAAGWDGLLSCSGCHPRVDYKTGVIYPVACKAYPCAGDVTLHS